MLKEVDLESFHDGCFLGYQSRYDKQKEEYKVILFVTDCDSLIYFIEIDQAISISSNISELITSIFEVTNENNKLIVESCMDSRFEIQFEGVLSCYKSECYEGDNYTKALFSLWC